MNSTRLYFDYNATTPAANEVLAAMAPYFKEHFVNPSSLYQLSRQPSQAIRKARRQVAALLNAADENEIIFTSGGTESNHTAIRAALAAHPAKKEIVTSAVEHSSVLRLVEQLVKEGYQIKLLPVDSDGQLRLDELRKNISDQTAVVSIMYANNETGVIFPIKEIAAIVKSHGICFHVDAVQCAGKFPLNVRETEIDFLSLSAHKFYGPKGIGALYVRAGSPFYPMIFGGPQERGRRAGTENVPGIVGFGAAAVLAASDLDIEISRLTSLRDYFEKRVTEVIPGVEINGKNSPRIANTSSICFEHTDSESLLMALDQKGICVSSGSACMSGANEPSHVLKAMGYEDAKAVSVLRFSFGRATTIAEIDYLISELNEVVANIRSIRRRKGVRQAVSAGV